MSVTSRPLPISLGGELPNVAGRISIALALLALCVGVFLRFYALDANGFWADEGISALHAAGNTRAAVLSAYAAHGTLTAVQLRAFETVQPGSTARSTIDALASEDAQHPPLYYLLLRGWEETAGNSIARMRLLSALIGVLLVPLAFWFALLLFESRGVATIAAAIAAVSPYQIEFSQNVREYGLWGVLTLASSIALLYALKNRKFGAWAAYVILCALGLYCHTFFALVLLAQIAFVVLTFRTRPAATLRSYVVSLVCIAAAYAPWLTAILGQLHRAGAGASGFAGTTGGVKDAIFSAFDGAAQAFFDLLWIDARWLPIAAAAVLLGAISLYVVIRHGSRQAATFLCCLIAANALLFVASGTLTVVPSRYLMPLILGLQLAAAFAIARGMNAQGTGKRVASMVLLIVVLLAGAFSSFQRTRHVAWWDSGYGEPLLPVAAIVDARPHQLVVGSTVDWATSMDLSRFVRDDVRFAMSGIHDPPLAKGTLLLSRKPDLYASYARRVALEALAVSVPYHDWQLVNELKSRRFGGNGRVTWLWRVEAVR